MQVLVHDRDQLIDVGPRQARRDASISGVRAIAPLVVGLAPLALTVGATAARADLPALVGWASSAFLYGASGQLTWIEVLHGGGPAALAVMATVLVNLQMLLYGTAMRTYWVSESRWWRVAAAQLLVGPVFAVATRHHRTEPDREVRRRFYMAAGLTLWTAWLGMTGIGYAVGGLPSVPVLALVTPLVMLTLALRAVVDAATGAALIVAAALAVAGIGLPYNLGSVGAAIAGVLTGIAVDSRTRRRHCGRTQESQA
jgi:predicted branched-subunit amino acid permease